MANIINSENKGDVISLCDSRQSVFSVTKDQKARFVRTEKTKMYLLPQNKPQQLPFK